MSLICDIVFYLKDLRLHARVSRRCLTYLKFLLSPVLTRPPIPSLLAKETTNAEG